MIYYTSDLHFGHYNIIKYCNRPYKNVDEMNLALIRNWNNKVSAVDDVYILGDFAFKNSNMTIDKIKEILNTLNGRKHLIIGNHDNWIDSNIKDFDLYEIQKYMRIKDMGKNVILFHYPIERWDCKYHDSIHLFGHIHNNPINYIKNRYNVGVDVNNYEPVTLAELIKGDMYGN